MGIGVSEKRAMGCILLTENYQLVKYGASPNSLALWTAPSACSTGIASSYHLRARWTFTPPLMKIHPLLKWAVMAAAIIASTPTLNAATNVWTGLSGSDIFWATPGNWSPSGPPAAGDEARF